MENKTGKRKYTDLFIDFDDTLYDTYGNAVIALRETFEACRLDRWFADPQLFFDAYWKANIELWGQYSRGEISRDYLIAERFRRPLMASGRWQGEGDDAQFPLHLSNVFLDFCSSKPGVTDGAHELMDYLRRKGYRMHLCSNGFHEVQYKKLDSCGLRGYFQTVVLSEDAGANKPSEAFFDYALRTSGADRRTTLMIGDNISTDILGAQRAGLDTLLFNRWGAETNVIKPTYCVTSLREIIHIL